MLQRINVLLLQRITTFGGKVCFAFGERHNFRLLALTLTPEVCFRPTSMAIGLAAVVVEVVVVEVGFAGLAEEQDSVEAVEREQDSAEEL
jgi:hypothetical protein